MDNESNFNNMGGGDNRPKLKKIKRPVKRPLVPGQGAVPPKTDATNRPMSVPQHRPVQTENKHQFNAPVKAGEVDAFSLDTYLDTDEVAEVNKKFITENDFNKNKTSKFKVGNLFTLNLVILVGAGALIFGMLLASIFSSGEKVVQNGLQGVVINPEIPRGRPRCGVAEKTQACVLYIMNPQRQELSARDFYDLAATLTGRQKFVIDTGNIRYSNIKIRPGEIAQINIPPLIN